MMMISKSNITLIILGLYAFFIFGLIIALIFWDESNIKDTLEPIPPEDEYCNGQGLKNLIPPINYQRSINRSNALFPLSTNNPTQFLSAAPNNIRQSYRVKDITNNIDNNTNILKISPNHWAGNIFYGNFINSTSDIKNNIFYNYPYYCRINDFGFDFCWSESYNLITDCFPNIYASCSTGSTGCSGCTGASEELILIADTFNNTEYDRNSYYSSLNSTTISITSTKNKFLSNNILDVDALTMVISWQFENPDTTQSLKNSTGSITAPMVKGSPYITLNIKNDNIIITPNFQFIITTISTLIYQIVPKNTSLINFGYLLFLSNGLTLSTKSNNIITFTDNITGTIRLAYYQDTDNNDMSNILQDYYNVYPNQCSISVLEPTNNNTNYKYTWNIDTLNTFLGSNNDLLMYALPHHIFSTENNIIEQNLDNIHNEILGIYRFIITQPTNSPSPLLSDNVNSYFWNLEVPISDIPTDPFIYEMDFDNHNVEELISICIGELYTLTNSIPILINMVEWFQWLYSISNVLLIAINAINNSTSNSILDLKQYIDILFSQLDLIRNTNGKISENINIVYDNIWGGIINNANITCQGGTDDNNSFYNSHIGQYGYLIYSYSVAAYINNNYYTDNPFWTNNQNIALLFVRDIINPYQNDTYFPLWRNKDWFYGYSYSTGFDISPQYGKETDNIGRIVLGYYACYMLSFVLKSSSITPIRYNLNNYNDIIIELKNWSLTMLATEISSLQHYFLFTSQDLPFNINDQFVQGTISNRFDSAYSYNTNAPPEIYFPNRTSYIMIPIIKPLILTSNYYLNQQWAYNITLPPMNNNIIDNEAFIYNIVLSIIKNPSYQNKQYAFELLHNRFDTNNYLYYGSTWSSIYYWIFTYN
jgi:endoglucanase Acf2